MWLAPHPRPLSPKGARGARHSLRESLTRLDAAFPTVGGFAAREKPPPLRYFAIPSNELNCVELVSRAPKRGSNDNATP